MTGILLAVKGAHETPHIRAHIGYARMPRGSSYVLDSYIDMILSKNNDSGKIITRNGDCGNCQ